MSDQNDPPSGDELPPGLVLFRNNLNSHVVTMTIEQAQAGEKQGIGKIVSQGAPSRFEPASRGFSPRESARLLSPITRVYASVDTSVLATVNYRLQDLGGEVALADLIATMLWAFSTGKITIDQISPIVKSV